MVKRISNSNEIDINDLAGATWHCPILRENYELEQTDLGGVEVRDVSGSGVNRTISKSYAFFPCPCGLADVRFSKGSKRGNHERHQLSSDNYRD